MSPEKLRSLSWLTFKLTFVCVIAGVILIIAVPNPSYRESTDLVVRIIATSGFGLIVIAVIVNFVSFISGAMAWFKGSGPCRWIIINGMILLLPIVAFILSWMNV